METLSSTISPKLCMPVVYSKVPVTINLPPHYTLDLFLAELTSFFGGAATIASREIELDDLRQTGTVVQFAVAFQTIINTFQPRWTDAAAIYFFSRKLKEQIRYLVAGKGDVPTDFQAYIAAAIAVEHNLAAGKHRHPPQQQQQQQQQQQPQRLQNPNPGRQPPPQAQNPADGARPMEVDGSRAVRGPLTQEERRRRAHHNLCAYCGQSGHLIATCPGAARCRQARGTYTGSDLPLAYVPPGFQFPPAHGSYPGMWALLPPQSTDEPPVVPKNEPPSQ